MTLSPPTASLLTVAGRPAAPGLPFGLALGGGPAWLMARRLAAADLAVQGLPNTHREDFRYTSLRDLPKNAELAGPRTLVQSAQRPSGLVQGLTPLRCVSADLRRGQLPPGGSNPPDSGELDQPPRAIGRLEIAPRAPDVTARLVIVDGRYVSELSEPGPHASGLAQAIAEEKPGVEWLGSRGFPDPVAALSLVAATDGVLIRVPRGVAAGAIEVVCLVTGGGGPELSLPRILVVAEADSSVTVVERHCSDAEAQRVVVPVTEVVAGRGSTVRHVLWQGVGPADWYLGSVLASVGEGATFEAHVVSLGGATARAATHVRFEGQHATTSLFGVFAPVAGQRLHHETVIDHAVPRCTSVESYKGVIAEGGQGGVSGRVLIAPNAVQSNAQQSLRALLLGPQAEANLKPQLEIDCDDVKAAHGAAIGQIDALQLFFLRARGLDEATARGLLIQGFVQEVLGKLPLASLVSAGARAVVERLGQSALEDGDLA